MREGAVLATWLKGGKGLLLLPVGGVSLPAAPDDQPQRQREQIQAGPQRALRGGADLQSAADGGKDGILHAEAQQGAGKEGQGGQAADPGGNIGKKVAAQRYDAHAAGEQKGRLPQKAVQFAEFAGECAIQPVAAEKTGVAEGKQAAQPRAACGQQGSPRRAEQPAAQHGAELPGDTAGRDRSDNGNIQGKARPAALQDMRRQPFPVQQPGNVIVRAESEQHCQQQRQGQQAWRERAAQGAHRGAAGRAGGT